MISSIQPIIVIVKDRYAVLNQCRTTCFRVTLTCIILILMTLNISCSHSSPHDDLLSPRLATELDGEDHLVIPSPLEHHREELLREIPRARTLVERRALCVRLSRGGAQQ